MVMEFGMFFGPGQNQAEQQINTEIANIQKKNQNKHRIEIFKKKLKINTEIANIQKKLMRETNGLF